MENLPDQDYIINVGPGGTFHKSGKYQTIPSEIDAIFQNFENVQAKKIAVYFHGGLVNEKRGLETVRKVQPYLSEAGTVPVCFVWETGLLETIGTNLSKISETKLFNKMVRALLKKLSGRLGFDSVDGRGIAGVELSDAEIELELAKAHPFREYETNVPGGNGRSAVNLETLAGSGVYLEVELRKEFTILVDKDEEFKEAIQENKLTIDGTGRSTGARGFISIATFIAHLAKIAVRVISRFISKRDHDFYPTIVEEVLRQFYIAELGAWVWKSMKDKSSEMWKSNEGREGLNQFAGRYFLDRLAVYKEKYPEVTIDLIGHSAGSIAICNLLGYTASLQKSFSYNHIIFLAPACRIELFKKEILYYPARYRDVRIFTMSDAYECEDRMIPYFYTHSLLYLISGILEDEGDSYDAYILGLQRHITSARPYDTDDLKDIQNYLGEADSFRVSYSKSQDGTSSWLFTNSISHSDFDDDPDTLASVQYFLKQ